MKIVTGIVTTERDVAAETDFLSVPWQIVDGVDGTDTLATLSEGVQSFPVTTTEDEVRNFLQAKLVTFQANMATHEAAKELQAGLDNASEVAGKITNITIE